jgi:hypothetical protein
MNSSLIWCVLTKMAPKSVFPSDKFITINESLSTETVLKPVNS